MVDGKVEAVEGGGGLDAGRGTAAEEGEPLRTVLASDLRDD